MKNLPIILTFLTAATFLVSSLPSATKEELGSIQPYALIDTINDTIEGLRASLPDNLNLTLSLPLDLSSFNIDLIKGNLTINNPALEGITKFLLPYVEIRGSIPANVHVILVMADFDVEVDYIADIYLLNLLNIYGDGPARIHLHDAQIVATGQVNILQKPLQFENLRIEAEVESVDISIHGLLHDENFSTSASSLLTLVANALVIPYVNNNIDTISDLISPLVQNVINDYLKNSNITISI